MKTRTAQASTALITVMLVIELLATVILGYLLWVTLGGVGGVAGCGDAGAIDCDHVLESRYSRWLFMPVALPALLLYAAMFAATVLGGPWSRVSTQRRAWWSLLAMTTLAAATAVWFIYLQAAVLGAFCLYCMAAHSCSLVLFGLAIAAAPRGWPDLSHGSAAAALLGMSPLAAAPAAAERGNVSPGGAWKAYRLSLLAGATAAAAMIAAQLAFAPASFTVTAEEEFSTEGLPTPQATAQLPPRTTAQPDIATAAAPTPTPTTTLTPAPSAVPRTLPLLGGKLALQVDQQLLLGPPSAEMLLVTLFDYTCPHCRAMHFQLRAARAHYGDRLGVILIPVPLNRGCNSAIDATSPQHDYACIYARLALVVWKHNRAAFPQFHDWLFEPLDAPPPGVARSRAAKLVTDQPLNEAILDPWVEDRLRDCVELYRRYDAGRIPKIVMAGQVITGDIERRKDLYRLIDSAFGDDR